MRTEALDSARGLDLAAEIGERLRHSALRHGGESTWLGRDATGVGMKPVTAAPTMRSLGGDVYGGTAGIALFLIELHRLRPLAWVPDLVRDALAFAKRTIHGADRDVAGGFTTGLAGVGYVSLRAAEVLGDGAAARDGQRLLSRNALELCASHRALDFGTGIAGVVVAASAMIQVGGMRDVAIAGADMLANAATRDEDAAPRWNMLGDSAANGRWARTGLSHGFSGLAAAFFAAHGVAGRAVDLELARAALSLEDRWYLPARSNWCDLRRTADDAPPSSVAARLTAPFSSVWCHGAPGIAIVRRVARDACPDDRTVASRLVAARRTAARSLDAWRPGADSSLCHGLMGLAECVSLADPDDAPRVGRALARGARAHAGDASWPSGVPSHGPNPSLFVGLAGIGHQLLRWAAGASVRPVLLPTASIGSR